MEKDKIDLLKKKIKTYRDKIIDEINNFIKNFNSNKLELSKDYGNNLLNVENNKLYNNLL